MIRHMCSRSVFCGTRSVQCFVGVFVAYDVLFWSDVRCFVRGVSFCSVFCSQPFCLFDVLFAATRFVRCCFRPAYILFGCFPICAWHSLMCVYLVCDSVQCSPLCSMFCLELLFCSRFCSTSKVNVFSMFRKRLNSERHVRVHVRVNKRFVRGPDLF